MKRWMLAAVVAVALLAGATLPARACGQGGGLAAGLEALLIGAGALGATVGDATFTIGDAVMAGQGKRPPLMWGVGEVLLAAPQAALLGWWAYSDLRSGRTEYTAGTIALTLWTAGLTAHGIYTIARADSTWRSTGPERTVSWNLAPSLVSAGQARAAPGAVLFGRF